jgi:hypothetical protein
MHTWLTHTVKASAEARTHHIAKYFTLWRGLIHWHKNTVNAVIASQKRHKNAVLKRACFDTWLVNATRQRTVKVNVVKRLTDSTVRRTLLGWSLLVKVRIAEEKSKKRCVCNKNSVIVGFIYIYTCVCVCVCVCVQ